VSDVVATVLRDAARLIERTGWWDGRTYTNGSGTQCVMTAISHVASSRHQGVYTDAMRCVTRELELEPENYSGIIYWNDAPERTVEDVLLVLKRAAVRAE